MSTLLASPANKPPRSGLNEDAVRYGELVQSIYDSLITDEESEYYNFSLYGKSEIFSKVLPDAKSRYTITRYIYSTIVNSDMPLLWRFSVKNDTTWVGYVAESTPEETQRSGKHEIVVAIRGTSSTTEWGKNFTSTQTEFKSKDASGNKVSLGDVHKGFLSVFTSNDSSLPFGDYSMKKQILKELKTLLAKYKNQMVKVTFVGHSLGGALATLAACDMGNFFSKTEYAANLTMALFTFGSPRVGNSAFKTACDKHLNGGSWRYVDNGDMVPFTPPDNFFFWKFDHVGEEIKVDPKSPYITAFQNPMNLHNLELYLHCVAANSTTRSTTTKCIGATTRSFDSVFQELKEKNPQSASLVENMTVQFKSDPEGLMNYTVQLFETLSKTSEDEDEGMYIRAAKRLKVDTELESPWKARPYSLLNKSASIVKESYRVPKSWMLCPFKDMKLVSGLWLDRFERPEDIPSEDNPEYN